MKKLLFLLVGLSLSAVVQGAPSYSFELNGFWNEAFLGGGPGAPGNILSADGPITFTGDINTYQFQILNATNQGAQPYNDPQGMYEFVTEYDNGRYFDSFFDIWFDIDLTNYTDIDNGIFMVTGEGTAEGGQGYSITFKGGGFIVISDTTGNAGFIEGTGSIACVPAPGALLLGSLGVALIGAIRRRLA
jgi:hypothetical protein